MIVVPGRQAAALRLAGQRAHQRASLLLLIPVVDLRVQSVQHPGQGDLHPKQAVDSVVLLLPSKSFGPAVVNVEEDVGELLHRRDHGG